MAEAAPRGEPPKTDEPVSDDLPTLFGKNLREARIKANLTQAQVAERTGLYAAICLSCRSRPPEHHPRHDDCPRESRRPRCEDPPPKRDAATGPVDSPRSFRNDRPAATPETLYAA